MIPVPRTRPRDRTTVVSLGCTWAVAAALLATGCQSGGFDRDRADAAALARAGWAAPHVEGRAADGWLADLRAPGLNALVAESLNGNTDLRAAAGRLAAAEARARIAGASLRPTIDGAGAANRRARASSVERATGVGAGGGPTNDFSLSLSFRWEQDLWGRLRDEQRAAGSELIAAQADLAAARLSLVANVVTAAANVLEAERQVALAESNVRALQVSLDVLDGQLELGLDDERTALDLSLATSDVARGRAALETRRQELEEARRSLELLMGRYPAAAVAGLREFPSLARSVPAGLPSELLHRRPDLQAAERRLAAAWLRAGAARKEFLPSVSLSGGGGLASSDLSRLLDWDRLFWDIAAGLSQPVLRGGELRARADQARAEAEQAAADYAGQVLQAFREVESALANERWLANREAELAVASREAQRAAELSIDAYERGLADIVTVLASQQRVVDAEGGLLSVRNQRLRNRVELYLALGGDFDTPARLARVVNGEGEAPADEAAPAAGE